MVDLFGWFVLGLCFIYMVVGVLLQFWWFAALRFITVVFRLWCGAFGCCVTINSVDTCVLLVWFKTLLWLFSGCSDAWCFRGLVVCGFFLTLVGDLFGISVVLFGVFRVASLGWCWWLLF